MTITFESIREQAEGPDAPKGMFHYTASAWQNAAETVADNEGSIESLDGLALASLEGLLCCASDAAAHEYFAKLGVKW